MAHHGDDVCGGRCVSHWWNFSTIPTVKIQQSGSFCPTGVNLAILQAIIINFWGCFGVCLFVYLYLYKQIDLPRVCLFVRQIRIYKSTNTWDVFFQKNICKLGIYTTESPFLQINCTNWLFCCAKVLQRFIKLCNESMKLICVSVNLVLV